MINKNSQKGISLIEVVIYVALLGGLSVLIAGFLLQITSVYARARAEREVLSNGRLILETIQKSAASSRRVYLPTSRFNTDLGQLSLATSIGADSAHSEIYVDFWVDNGRMWTRAEGGTAIPLSAATVRITKFRLEHIFQGLGRQAVKVTLDINSASKFTATSTLNLTTALKGNY